MTFKKTFQFNVKMSNKKSSSKWEKNLAQYILKQVKKVLKSMQNVRGTCHW